jgi:hypothetical protein
VFTQTAWGQEGFAIRDPDSTTYSGAIESAEEFGRRIYLEAWKRGWSRAEKRIVIGDGAEWIWNLAQDHFPRAIQIVDLYHARRHLWDLARRLHPQHEEQQKTWMKVHQKRLLDKGKSKNWWRRCDPLVAVTPRSPRRSGSRPTISKVTRSPCDIPSFVSNIYSWDRV